MGEMQMSLYERGREREVRGREKRGREGEKVRHAHRHANTAHEHDGKCACMSDPATALPSELPFGIRAGVCACGGRRAGGECWRAVCAGAATALPLLLLVQALFPAGKGGRAER